ncbi:MAG: hypothetical protein ACREYC_09255, partial [Gammaproteobacteria bacterium]
AGAIDSIVDLTERINSADSIAAIFNESWAVTQNPRDSSIKVTDPRLGIDLFELVSPRAHWKVDERQALSHRLNISIRNLTRRASGSERIYFRFRVNKVPKDFYAVGHSQGDRGLVSSWTRTEFIDFRLNVRRGAPPNLERNVGEFVSFSKVHLFLMRQRSHELVFQDNAFRSCRSLEDESFWAKYSHMGDNADSDEIATTLRHVKDSLGYQWTKRIGADSSPVHEFGILARFKRIHVSAMTFIVIAVTIGAGGNAAWEGIKWLASNIISW